MKKTAHAFNEENIKYLRGILGDEKVDTFILVLDPKSDRVISSEDDQKSFDTVKKCLEQMENSVITIGGSVRTREFSAITSL